MTQANTSLKGDGLYPIIDFKPEPMNFKRDVLEGLGAKRKTLKPVYFYDEVGSRLFYEICECPEYYPARTDIQILQTYAHEIVQSIPENSTLIEPGGGGSRKVEYLLKTGKFSSYIPVDVSKAVMLETAEELAEIYKEVQIKPIVANFIQKEFDADYFTNHDSAFIFFPGSTIGNMDPSLQSFFFDRVRRMLGQEGFLLLGVDLRKDVKTIESAYNDEGGLTAQFNKNLLKRMNLELGANFQIDSFHHKAIYNEQFHRLEMHLVSEKKQTVRLGNRHFEFESGETIHTENSYKFDLTELERLAELSGFSMVEVFSDERNYFAEVLFRCNPFN